MYELKTFATYVLPGNIKFLDAIQTAFIGAFIKRPILNPPFWTLRYEFIGLFAIYIVSLIFYKRKIRTIAYCVIYLAVHIWLKDIYFSALFLGMLLSDLLFNDNEDIIKNNWIRQILGAKCDFLASIFGLGLVYWMTIKFGKYAVQFRLAFTLLLIWLMVNSEIWQCIMEQSFFMKISRISFEIYAVHWLIICSFSSWFMVRYRESMEYGKLVGVCFCLTSFIVIIMAVLLKSAIRSVDKFLWIRK